MYCKAIREHYSDTTIHIGLLGYSLGGGLAFALSIKYPDLFKVIIQNAPFVAYNTPSGKLPNHRDVDSVVKFYPTIELMPNPKMPLLFMEKFYEDEYQVR